MLATTQRMGLDVAFPNFCRLPNMIPFPFPDLAFPMAAIPVAVTILFNNSFAHNLATVIPLTVGDFPGVARGIISQTVSSASRRFLLNSYTTLIFGTPANRMGCLGTQNRINCIGATVIPGCAHIFMLAA